MDRPREQVLEAALAMIGEQGLGKVTMASLAARLGTSGGHLLYYFGTRDGLLLETLRWSEQQYAVQRAPLVEQAVAGEGSLAAVLSFAEVYLPLDDRDPRWLLWLELWARAPYDPELASAQRELDEGWHRDLVVLLRAWLTGITDADAVSERLRAMWDGFAISIVNGGGTTLRDAVVEHTRATLQPLA
ncbi:TetR/AcrR family transcriptional regulator [Nocardioides sp.]|uniref:TetR/AcrR family transcriptional regulator n=1 Tax=Nocardioides sp. TaxID=35761 RepID=UPI002C526AC1|nr:TetR family transcriptional regulator C-terminal domain-containing protein [Nocardioides sp.]HXH78444.1 TetR family transcriptional regulator C-terminal domain-containing protein [Nocardioides sp.]